MTLKIKAGKYYRTRDGRKVGPMVEETPRWSEWPWDVKNGEGNLRRMLWKDDGTADETQDADLIAEWPDHIITHEGRQYDITALETPFGLLPEPVKAALKAWPHGVHVFASFEGTYQWGNLGIDWSEKPLREALAHRAKPAPVETRVACWRSAWNCTREHGTCVKRADDSIDWTTWEPEA